MGRQTKIARKIVDGGGAYVLAVKGNQKSLYGSIRRFFEDQQQDDFARVEVRRTGSQEHGHGRDETRRYYLCRVPEKLADQERWPQLRAIGMAVNETVCQGKATREIRYYILSQWMSARP